MKKILKITIQASFNGIMFTLPYCFDSLFFLLFFAFVPIFLFANKHKNIKLQVYYAFICVNIWFFFALIWIHNGEPPILLSSFGIFVFCLIIFFPFLTYFSIINRLNIKKNIKYLLFALIWLSIEWLNFEWELAFPFLTLGYYMGNIPCLIQWYSFTGVLGGSLWILLVNFCIIKLIDKDNELKNTNSIFIAIVFIPLILSLSMNYLLESNQENTKKIFALNLNGGANHCSNKTQLAYAIDLLNKINIDKSTDFIILPENLCYLPASSIPYNTYFSGIKKILRQKDSNAKVIFGVETQNIMQKPSFNRDTCFNSILCCDSTGFTSFRNKIRFVPFGEFIPYYSFFGKIPDIEKFVNHNLYSANKYDNMFQVDNITVLPLICYELYFNTQIARYVRKNVNLIICVSNDYICQKKTFANHFIRMARTQAISCRKSVVKSTISGYSLAISPKGKTLAISNYNITEFINANIPINNTKTIFVRFGNLVTVCIWFILFIIVSVFNGLSKKKII